MGDKKTSWMSIADHGVRKVRRPIGSIGDPWSNPDYLLEHTPPALLFARLHDLANRYVWEEGNETG